MRCETGGDIEVRHRLSSSFEDRSDDLEILFSKEFEEFRISSLIFSLFPFPLFPLSFASFLFSSSSTKGDGQQDLSSRFDCLALFADVYCCKRKLALLPLTSNRYRFCTLITPIERGTYNSSTFFQHILQFNIEPFKTLTTNEKERNGNMTTQPYTKAIVVSFVILASLNTCQAAFQFHANIIRSPASRKMDIKHTHDYSLGRENANRYNNLPYRSKATLQISKQDQEGEMDIGNSPSIASKPKSEDSSNGITIHSKLSTLKDRMWVREALEDLTAAEFACSIAASTSSGSDSATGTGTGKKNKRAVDFDNILTKLEKRIEDMCVIVSASERDESCLVSYPLSNGDLVSEGDGEREKSCWVLKKNFGMGSVTYTDEQRNVLVM